MMNAAHSWRVGALHVRLVEGDLFGVPAQAIVNSEQSDFVLSWNPHTISGSLNRRYGSQIQPELDRQTSGKVLPPGTVLTTGPSGPYQCVYHAGFHSPTQWLGTEEGDLGEDDATDYIRQYVRSILTDAEARSLNAVAFPLLGAGVFGLDAALLAYQFAREMANSGMSRKASQMEVWIAVKGASLGTVHDALVQGCIDALYGDAPIADVVLGIGFIDRFNVAQVHAAHPLHKTWVLARYAELLLQYLLMALATVCRPALQISEFLLPGEGFAFGRVRNEVQNLALKLEGNDELDLWSRFFVRLILDDLRLHHRVLRMTEDRNRIAHGKAARAPEEFEADLRAFLKLEEWRTLIQQHGEPGEAALGPWLATGSETAYTSAPSGRVGILERWYPNKNVYLIPETGQLFHTWK